MFVKYRATLNHLARVLAWYCISHSLKSSENERRDMMPDKNFAGIPGLDTVNPWTNTKSEKQLIYCPKRDPRIYEARGTAVLWINRVSS